MFSSIRKRLTWPNVALTLALVFVMTGGAYAAKKVLITSTKQISPKVLKELRGKAGLAGAPGAQGPAGPAGPAGPEGKGTKGDKGDPGTPGTKGETGAAGTKGATGPAGTTGLEGEAGLDGIDGKNGATGPEGSPWTAGGTLPSGKTETGAWSFGPIAEASVPLTFGHQLHVTVASFAIPLAAALNSEHVHWINVGEPAPAGCTGGTAEQPTAEPGNLCVYAGEETEMLANSETIRNPVAKETLGSSTTGAFAEIFIAGEKASGNGTWAVTAE